MILRTFMDTFSAHHAVNGLHMLLLPFCVNAFNPHGTDMIAGAAFRTGSAVLFQLEQVKSFEQPHQISHRADNAPEALDEKAANQQDYSKKTSQIQIRPIAST